MQAEGRFNSNALAAAVKRQRNKLLPKPMSAENAKFKADRAGEKMANAARAMGKKVESFGGAGAKKASSAVSAGSKTAGPISLGSKSDWIGLIKLLKAGGRECSGGLGSVDFELG